MAFLTPTATRLYQEPDTRVGQGTADLPKHCLERYSLESHFHTLQKGATQELEDAIQ